jgi:hypothetical protein
MTKRPLTRGIAGVLLAAAILESAACAPRAFDRYLRDQQWADASRTFTADSGLMNDERALYDAGILYSAPARPTYDPARAAQLLRRLLNKFPTTEYRASATDRLALIDALLQGRDSAGVRQRDLEARISNLAAEARRMRAVLDSAQAQNDVLRRNTTKLESDLRDRDDQLRALRRELRQLKDVDLKPRPSSPRPP